MKAIRTKRIVIEKECECEVKYYVLAKPFTDARFRPESNFVVEDKYFDTKEEAENFKTELEKERGWVVYEIREKIIEWLE